MGAVTPKLATLKRMRYEPEEVWLPCSEDQLGWDDDFHQLMLNDELRMAAYQAALSRAVSRGMTVLDLGTGTGVLARWSFEAGADRVYAIEVNEVMAEKARANLEQAGFGGRFELFRSLSYDVELPQRVDLVVSEIMGNLGDNEDCVAILKDARERFLKPAGSMLPLSMETFMVPVAAEKAHRHVEQKSCRALNSSYSLADLLQRLRLKSQFNLYYDVILPRSSYLSAPQPIKACDFLDARSDLTYEVERTFRIERDGKLTGFKGYFVATLAPGVVLDISGDSIEERATSDSWKHCYLPVSKPLAVRAGDELRLRFARSYPASAKHSPFSKLYSWSGEVRRAGKVVGSYEQGMSEQVQHPLCEPALA